MKGKDFKGTFTLIGERITPNDNDKIFTDVNCFGRYKFAVVYTELVIGQPIKEERFGCEIIVGHRNVGYQQINYYENEKDALEFLEICASIEPSELGHCYINPFLVRQTLPEFAKNAQKFHFVASDLDCAMAFSIDQFGDDGYLIGYPKERIYHFDYFSDNVLGWFDTYQDATEYADQLNGYDGEND